jgi:hypothetical protein
MKYLLGGTALLLLVFSSAAMADNVFNCQDVGLTTPEPIGDQDGHVLVVDNFSCRVDAGAMAGGVMTGTVAWDLNKGKGTLISGTGVIRKPGSLVIYKDGEGTLNLTMNDKGQVTGGSASGRHLGVCHGRCGSPEGQGVELDLQGDRTRDVRRRRED